MSRHRRERRRRAHRCIECEYNEVPCKGDTCTHCLETIAYMNTGFARQPIEPNNL